MSATLSKTFVKTNCVFRSGNREDEGAAGDHCVVELAVGDLRAVKCAAAIFAQAKVLPETLDAVDRAAGDLGADDRAVSGGTLLPTLPAPGG